VTPVLSFGKFSKLGINFVSKITFLALGQALIVLLHNTVQLKEARFLQQVGPVGFSDVWYRSSAILASFSEKLHYSPIW